jgi:CRP-like cAMP-binding protein
MVSETYESQVPGLYIIGALAGYPLIKHCLNQGYEVIEYILGNNIAPADEPLTQAKLDHAKLTMTVAELVTAVRERLPLFATLTPLQIREFLIRADLYQKQPGEAVFALGAFANSVYFILDGEVGIRTDPNDPQELARLKAGEFFGELALLSGRRRTRAAVATASSLLLEVDRNSMIRLVRSAPEVKQAIDTAAVIRQIKVQLAPEVDDQLLDEVVRTAQVVQFKPDDTLIEEGAHDDSVYLIQSGSVTVSARVAGKDIVSAYIPAGNYVGEMVDGCAAMRDSQGCGRHGSYSDRQRCIPCAHRSRPGIASASRKEAG